MDPPKTYSINGLAEATGKDRRTLKKLLRGLPPADERDIGGGRIEKRWTLEHVELYLDLQKQGYDAEETWASGGEMLKQFTGAELIPKLLAHPTFEQAILGACHGEHGLSKTAALNMLAGVGVIIVTAITEIFHDPDMQFRVPQESVAAQWANASRNGRASAYLAEKWPDETKRKAT